MGEEAYCTHKGSSDITLDASSDSDTNVADVRCHVAASQQLLGRFMSLDDSVKQLMNADEPMTERVPNGVKENVWFKIISILYK